VRCRLSFFAPEEPALRAVRASSTRLAVKTLGKVSFVELGLDVLNHGILGIHGISEER
jgi:hypothetical protein